MARRGWRARVAMTRISVPLGLIALNWLRLYKPLVAAGLPQMPNNAGTNGLGFAKAGWLRISNLAPLDLRVGARVLR